MRSTGRAIVESFVAAINKRDPAAIASLMTEDHTFIDASGAPHVGRDTMSEGWKGYFAMFSDYEIQIERVLADKSVVAVFGYAAGTYNGKRGLVADNRIAMPAAWRALIENGKVKLWQVYADWTDGWKIIEKDKASS